MSETTENAGWYGHNGVSDPPIPGDTFVQVRFRDGDQSRCGAVYDWDQNWQWADSYGEHDGDIIAWRPLFTEPPNSILLSHLNPNQHLSQQGRGIET